MEQELSNYILMLINEKKGIDYSDLANMCAIIAKAKHLEGYISSFSFVDNLDKDAKILNYSYPKRAMIMYNVPLEDNSSLFGPNFKGFSNQEYALINILDILYHMLVEFQKVYQWKIASSNMQDMESLIIRANLLHNAIFSKEKIIDFADILPRSMYKLWEKYRDNMNKKVPNFSPIDHLAEYEALMEILHIADKLNGEAKGIMYFLKAKLFQNLIENYKKHIWGINAPTIDYFSAIGFLDIFKNQSFYAPSESIMCDNIVASLSLDRRLKYALPITKKEYKEIETRCV